MKHPPETDAEKLNQYERTKKKENRKFLLLVAVVGILGAVWLFLYFFK